MSVYKLNDWVSIRVSSSKAPERVSTISSARQWHFCRGECSLNARGIQITRLAVDRVVFMPLLFCTWRSQST